MNGGYKILCLLAFLLATAALQCALPFSQREERPSIFDRSYMLHIEAESFPEYSWNEVSRKTYDTYLTILNEYYYRFDYARCVTGLYELLEQYPYDARYYALLAECLARSGDTRRAADVLETGSRHISGFSRHPGIQAYREDLTQAARGTTAVEAPKGIFGKTVAVLTWAPRKIMSIF